MTKINHLTSKRTIKDALAMAWPAVCESFFVALAGMVDSLMVSKLGSNAVAAVGLTTQPKFLGLALFFATNISISAIVARRRGEKKQQEANQILAVALTFIVLATVIISTICVLFASPIIQFCGSDVTTHADAVLYYRIVMGGMIFNVLSMGINAAQRGSGNTKIAMRTNLTSNVVNVVGNYLLIQGHLGFPSLGIKGAAIATVFGTVIACIMSFASLMKKDNFVSIPYIIKNRIKPAIQPLIQILKMASSLFIEQILMRIGFMSTSIMAADMGMDAMAAHQVGMNILSLTFSFGDGMQVAAVALIGRSLGEKDPEKAKEYGKVCRYIGLAISLVLAVLYLTCGRLIYRAFFEEEVIIGYGIQIIRIICVIVLFQISQVIYMGCLRGAGDTAYTAMASTISVTLIRTAFSYILCYPLGLGMAGIWLGILADQISRFLFGSLRFRAGKWVKIKI